ncbi:hypothetical protein NOVOSPHI9U_710008 [Novosphingobium sp. 9U]|nr:hypothetical protein NOVOSPHI9U_710008 [Novosphingobium sp. 9U]
MHELYGVAVAFTGLKLAFEQRRPRASRQQASSRLLKLLSTPSFSPLVVAPRNVQRADLDLQ